GAVDVGVPGLAGLGLQAVLLVPDVLGRRLHRDRLVFALHAFRRRGHRLQPHCTHPVVTPSSCADRPRLVLWLFVFVRRLPGRFRARLPLMAPDSRNPMTWDPAAEPTPTCCGEPGSQAIRDPAFCQPLQNPFRETSGPVRRSQPKLNKLVERRLRNRPFTPCKGSCSGCVPSRFSSPWSPPPRSAASPLPHCSTPGAKRAPR